MSTFPLLFPSPVQSILDMSEKERFSVIRDLTPKAQRALWSELRAWKYWGRENQYEPEGDWFYWLIQAGRGWGKTRTAIEYIRRQVDARIWRTVNIAAPTWMDVLDTMVNGSEGAPGLMGVWPPHRTPKLKLGGSNPHMICWNGAMIRLRAAKEAERFRGPQADGGWVDEIDSWSPNKMSAGEALSLFEFGIRLGDDPRIVATSTPKRGRLVAKLRQRDDVAITRGSTYDNKANLAGKFLKAVETQHGGTSLGKQELLGELLEIVEGALVTLEMLKANDRPLPSMEKIIEVVIAIDPSGGGEEDQDTADEKGLIVAGKDRDDHVYMLRDLSTRRGPEHWGESAVRAYYSWGASRIIGERNYGGDMVASTCRAAARALDLQEPEIEMVTASRGKHVRFAPVGALHRRGRAHLCEEDDDLRTEITGFTETDYEGEGSPNRADAWVWGVHALTLEHEMALQIF